jgi:hypothetical protein
MKRRNAIAFILLMSLAGTSCQRLQRAQISMESSVKPISAGALGSSAPRLGLWVPNTIFATVAGDESQSQLQLQFSRDGGDTFAKPIILSEPNAKIRAGGENSPVLGTDMRGDIYAAWLQSGAGRTQLMVKPIDPNPGSPVNVLDADRNPDAYAGFPTLAVTHSGDVYVAWLDERDKAEGSSSVYFSRSTDHSATFNRNVRIATSACVCCRPQIYVAPSGDIYLAWRQVFTGDVRDMVLSALQRWRNDIFAAGSRGSRQLGIARLSRCWSYHRRQRRTSVRSLAFRRSGKSWDQVGHIREPGNQFRACSHCLVRRSGGYSPSVIGFGGWPRSPNISRSPYTRRREMEIKSGIYR